MKRLYAILFALLTPAMPAAADPVLVEIFAYLADADPMALPESSERQRVYVERFELRGPYTPQTVVDGALQCPGNKKSQIKRLIDRRLNADEDSDITILGTESSVTLSGGLTLPRDVLLVHYLSDYSGDMPNPVVKLEKLGQWSGGPSTFPATCNDACAVLVQEVDTGEILHVKVMP